MDKLENTDRLHIHYFNDYVTEGIKKLAQNMQFEYSDVLSLKDLQYKGVEIGYAAFSSFVTFTRNMTPQFNAYFHHFIDDNLRAEVILIEVVEKMILSNHFDKIIVHNGRFPNLKPIYQLAKRHNINYEVTERVFLHNGESYIDNYINTIPHSPKARYDKMTKLWNEADDSKYDIARSFFENKLVGKYAGDKNYISKQKIGELPDGFDEQKRNIAIFNSSEDEICSISKEIDNSGLYPNQYVALKSLFDHYKDNQSIHFYLRIHPNLGNVPYESHMILYTLQYDNVTIIPPYSPVNTYALMNACEKVITFNSTMTIESTYWGKAVIVLVPYYYVYLDVAYHPKSESEFFDLIDDSSLAPKKQENCLIAAYRFMRRSNDYPQYFTLLKKRHKWGPIHFTEFSLFSIMGSTKLYGILCAFLKLLNDCGLIGTYNHIAKYTK
jgi:hypothetical protein